MNNREIENYRSRSADPKMSGVMSPSFRCIKCSRVRATAGRKKLASGWICAECVSARKAAALLQQT